MTHPAPADPPETPSTSLASLIGHLAATIAAEHFPTGDRAALRRLNPDTPPNLAFYRFAFRHLPQNWENRRTAWTALVAGIALMCPKPHRPDRSVGLTLAETGYSEKRLERLLAAEGDTLHTLLLRAARFLAAKNESCNWTDFAHLLLDRNPEKARLKIARDYYRNLKDHD
ncbi:type I-E CRISPR-associated protein Cse2/CasB [Methylococcus capsulatus]|uniref:type I-E CRISPR-associated protein Cse2/CasB n=1 Tax=Methylococcus capsulatus TaxID=414 RepID=UPI001C52999D|nr:type I-E CRISPR-associated protein Cse2/CasB [Methylococcus capsulatus]QXP88315.1 type I-E CRISPR-associated protein Cse2/CasB [Methylococcus capsulatus]QXP94677.1 type I-E CRISPR-associated protein Cse2/CasB [Methylococcus capsulatus]UQN13354.1 type I-E CRISPR-associated protein Cse2/CasB [Methylococcus capsulatus]